MTVFTNAKQPDEMGNLKIDISKSKFERRAY